MARLHKLPVPLGEYRGTPYSRYTVVLRQSGLSRDYWQREIAVEVVAESPVDACRFVQAEFSTKVSRITEIECLGPKGGMVHRDIGFARIIETKAHLFWLEKESQFVFPFAETHY